MVPSLRFDPTFLEEAVFLSVKDANEPGVRALFHAQRNKIYEDLQRQESRFGSLYAEWFEKLGIQVFFERIIGEFPSLAQADRQHFIKRVWTTKEEGADLYREGVCTMVLMRLQPGRLLQRSYLEAFLRHEWMHVNDMLSPAFDYSPHAPLGGQNSVEDDLIRERFRILWNLTIDARMTRRGFDLPVPMHARRKEWEKAFSPWDADRRESMFQEMQSDRLRTQAELIAIARDKRLTMTLGEGGLRCPLCQFPSHETVREWTGEGVDVASVIAREMPGWTPAMGACRQCFDLYACKNRGT